MDAAAVAQMLNRRVVAGPNGCILWAKHIDRDGYGRVRCGDRMLAAHRVSYEAAFGEIPAGLVLDHLCRTTACVNPLHLEPVTTAENILRGESFAARNARKHKCDRGHDLSGDNLYRWRGKRICRACGVLRAAARRAGQLSASPAALSDGRGA